MPESPYDYLLPILPEPAIDPAKTALVIIDMQYFDAHPDYGWGRRLAEQGVAHLAAPYFERLSTVIPNIQRLQRACRAAGVEVIFVRIEMQKRDLRDASPSYRLRGFASPRGSKEAEILAEIAPRPDEVVISKTSSGAFNSTNIDQVLRNLGIEVLIVCGVNTNACVELTSRDAADRNYWVLLAEDACAAIGGEAVHRDAIARLDSGMIKVKTTAELGAQIEALAGPPAGVR